MDTNAWWTWFESVLRSDSAALVVDAPGLEALELNLEGIKALDVRGFTDVMGKQVIVSGNVGVITHWDKVWGFKGFEAVPEGMRHYISCDDWA